MQKVFKQRRYRCHAGNMSAIIFWKQWSMRTFSTHAAGFLSVHCRLGALMASAWQFRGFGEGSREPLLIDVRIPPHCLGLLSAEGAGLGLCGPWGKKEVLSIVTELMASHNNKLLLPCAVACNNPALSPCSPRTTWDSHSWAQLSASLLLPWSWFSQDS